MSHLARRQAARRQGPARIRPAVVGMIVCGMMSMGGLAVMTPAAHATIAPSDRCSGEMHDPLSLYGESLRFRVLRNGSPIGYHEVTFDRRGDKVVAHSRFEAEVRILFYTAYRYQYRSRDVWRDGCLVALKAETNDNGKEMRVEAALEGEALRITSSAGTRTTELGIFPTTHWNAGVIGATRVLNTITGTIAKVELIALGKEEVMVEGRPVPAHRYRYTGEIESEVWYDADGRWVKMRFNAQDGSTIEYVCERCGGGSGSA